MNFEEPKYRESSSKGLGAVGGETGWHTSRYNVEADLPGTEKTVIVNLLRGTCHEFSPLERYLLSVVEELGENHPALGLLARRGVIANFDERAALEAMGRIKCAQTNAIGLTICPTLNCNFACPYCFEDHAPGIMLNEVQDDVVSLAKRMLESSGASELRVNWFGGEPLIAPQVIVLSLREFRITMRSTPCTKASFCLGESFRMR